MSAANPYRGQISLALPSGEALAVVDANALRLLMEDLGQTDLTTALEELQTNALDRIPRLLFHGVRQHLLLTGSDEEPPKWEAFAAQLGQLNFVDLVERVGLALNLDDGEEKKRDVKVGAS